jgi:COP9 signalosome complex subunit 7
MPSIRELEDLIIDAIYLDILRGKLDQKEQQLEVEYTMGRDLEPGRIEKILAALKDWYVTISPLIMSYVELGCHSFRVDVTSTVLTTLDSKLTNIASYSAASAVHQAEHEKVLQSTLKDVIDRQKEAKLARRGGAAYALDFSGRERDLLRDRENIMMDVDDDVKGKNRK